VAQKQDSRAATRVNTKRQPRALPYDFLRDAIVTGEFPAGASLVETSLADLCQVSRTPIREALRRLEQDGLVVRSERGMVVRERSPDEILDIYETRIVLEATVGRIAADRRSELDLGRLESLLEMGQAVDPGDVEAKVDANSRFHQALWQSSHNDSLIDVLGRLDLHLSRYPGTTLAYPVGGPSRSSNTPSLSARSRLEMDRPPTALLGTISLRPETFACACSPLSRRSIAYSARTSTWRPFCEGSATAVRAVRHCGRPAKLVNCGALSLPAAYH